MKMPPLDLYIEAQGTGPVIVMLHGWGLNVRVWDSVVAALKPQYKTVVVDLPGHGRSTWRDEARTLTGMATCVGDALASSGLVDADQSVTLLGWSLGGQIALELAARFAEHAKTSDAQPIAIHQLVLVATTPKFAAAADWPHGMAGTTLEGFARHLAQDYRQTVSDFLELQVRGSAHSEDVLATLRKALFAHGEASREALTAGLAMLEAADLRPKLASIRQRALVISGQYDRVTSAHAGQALVAGLPQANYLEIRRAGHAPFLSHTDEFVGAVNDFLSSHAS